MQAFRNVFIALLLVLLIVIVLQNTESVETKILFVTLSMPRALLLLLATLIGVVVGLLAGTRLSRPKKKGVEP